MGTVAPARALADDSAADDETPPVVPPPAPEPKTPDDPKAPDDPKTPDPKKGEPNEPSPKEPGRDIVNPFEDLDPDGNPGDPAVEATEPANVDEELEKFRTELIRSEDQSTWSGVLDVLAKKDIENGDLAKGYRRVVGPLLQDDQLLANMTPERRLALRAHLIRHMLQDVPEDAYPSSGESTTPIEAPVIKPPPLLMGSVLRCVIRAGKGAKENALLQRVRRMLSRDPTTGRQRGWDRLLDHAIRTAADADSSDRGLRRACDTLTVASEERLGRRSVEVVAGIAGLLQPRGTKESPQIEPGIVKSDENVDAILDALARLLPYQFGTIEDAQSFLAGFSSRWATLSAASPLQRLALDRDVRIAVAALEREGPERARGRIEEYGKRLIGSLGSAAELVPFLDPAITPEPVLQRAAMARLLQLQKVAGTATAPTPVDRLAVDLVIDAMTTSKDGQVVRSAVDVLATEQFRAIKNGTAKLIADALVTRLNDVKRGDAMRVRSNMAELLGVYGDITHMNQVLTRAEEAWRAAPPAERNAQMAYYGDVLDAAAAVRNASVHVLRSHFLRATQPEDAPIRVAIAAALEAFASSTSTPPPGPAAEALLRHIVSGAGDAAMGDWRESDPGVRRAAVRSLRVYPTKASAYLLAGVVREENGGDVSIEAVRALGRHVRAVKPAEDGSSPPAPALERLESLAADEALVSEVRVTVLEELARPQAVAVVVKSAHETLVTMLNDLLKRDDIGDAIALAAAKATVAHGSIDGLPAIQTRWAATTGEARRSWDRVLMSGLHACVTSKDGVTLATRVLRQIANSEPRSAGIAEALRLMEAIASSVERHPLLRRARADLLMSRGNDESVEKDERLRVLREAKGHYRFLAGLAEGEPEELAHMRGAYNAILATARIVVSNPKDHAEALLEACAIARATKKRELAKNAMEGPVAELEALKLDEDQKTRLESTRKALRDLAAQ